MSVSESKLRQYHKQTVNYVSIVTIVSVDAQYLTFNIFVIF